MGHDELGERVIAARRIVVRTLEAMFAGGVSQQISDQLDLAWDNYDDAVIASARAQEAS